MDYLGSQEMSRDQFVWGLSNGVGVLAISGAFWLGLAAWGVGFTALLIALTPILVLGGALMVGSLRLRRKAAGFSPRSRREAPRGSPSRRIIIGFYAVSAAQWVSILLVGGICTALHRPDMIWPLIGMVISLHFLPLGWVFGVRPYYVMGVVGTAMAGASILAFTDGARLVAVGLGLGLLTIGGATYILTNPEALVTAGLLRSSGPASNR